MTRMDVPADAATSCSGQWRRDARVLGSLPFEHQGSWAPSLSCTDATHAVSGVPLSVAAVMWQLGRFLFGSARSSESAPCVTWSVLGSPTLQHCPPLPGGRRPLTHSPQREVVSGPDNTEGAHPTASGRLAVAGRKQPLRDDSPGSESSPICMVGSWVAALQTQTVALFTQSYPADFEVTLLQRGCIFRILRLIS